jgi:hypothetical protein
MKNATEHDHREVRARWGAGSQPGRKAGQRRALGPVSVRSLLLFTPIRRDYVVSF